MEFNKENFAKKIRLLKELRLQTLRLHKSLIDSERQVFENKNGQLTTGQFLQVLLNDSKFSWLRKFSMLIVEIDEMFDLDDDYPEEMVEKQFSQLQKLLYFESSDEDFNFNFRNSIQNDPEIESKHKELKRLLPQK